MTATKSDEGSKYSGFVDVDRQEDSGYFVDYLDFLNSLPQIQAYKRRSLELLRAQPGNAVLDLGCGTGQDLITLHGAMGGVGRLVGVDNSQTMIDLARAQAAMIPASDLEFHVADACSTGFPDKVFDCVRADRCLMHLEEPQAAVVEMARVARPGGRIVVADVDWGTLVIAGADPSITTTITDFLESRIRHSRVGRDLRRLLVRAGLPDVDVEIRPVTYEPFAVADKAFSLRRVAGWAVQGGVLSSTDAESWFAALEAASLRGEFFSSVNLVLASAMCRQETEFTRINK